MKRVFLLSGIVLLSLTVSAWGAWFRCCNWGIHCMEPPADCPDCSEPHHRLGHNSCHVQEWLDKLCSGDCCCERIKAAEKLGHRMHADYCTCPEVLDGLIRALQNDTCWEVRRAAAWSIAMQGARTETAVLALYLASRLDHHYMVRDKALESLDILLVCRRGCYTELFARADTLIVEMRKRNLYRPGQNNFNVVLGSSGDGALVLTAPGATTAPQAGVELLAPPAPSTGGAKPMPK
jgi:hypothetical protein